MVEFWLCWAVVNVVVAEATVDWVASAVVVVVCVDAGVVVVGEVVDDGEAIVLLN